MRALKIMAMVWAGLLLFALGSLLPWKVAAENLAAFDGTVYATLRTASLANFPATVGGGAVFSPGALVFERGPRFNVTSSPGAGNQATASIVANATGRHVADCVSYSAVSTGAVTATAFAVNLRDGATGAGNVIHAYQATAVTAAAAGAQVVPPFEVCGLNLVGTTNTAMTFEMSAGVANVQPTVNLTTYLVQ
jgi:hypothetical protein